MANANPSTLSTIRSQIATVAAEVSALDSAPASASPALAVPALSPKLPESITSALATVYVFVTNAAATPGPAANAAAIAVSKIGELVGYINKLA